MKVKRPEPIAPNPLVPYMKGYPPALKVCTICGATYGLRWLHRLARGHSPSTQPVEKDWSKEA